MIEPLKQAYRADITAGALKLPESRIVADLLLRNLGPDDWHDAIVARNVLQARNPATARRMAKLIRSRLELMEPELWRLIRDGRANVATHAALAAAVKHSRLLGDFLQIVVSEQYRTFTPKLSNKLWADYLEGCRGRDPTLRMWSATTQRRLRSTVFQVLAQAGYVEDTQSLRLQSVYIAEPVQHYLAKNREDYILRSIQVAL
jgi:hypothetical protein